MDPLRFETELIELLTGDGWIDRLERDRQDLHVTWTARGQQQGARFIEAVHALQPDRVWTESEQEQLRDLGLYFGFIEATRRDRTRRSFAPFVRDRNLLVVSTARSGHRRYRLFTARAFADFYDHVEREQDEDREVMLISIADVLASNVGKAFPFGAQDSKDGVVWKRGE